MTLSLWILLALVAALFVILARSSRTTVFEYERGLKFTRGRLKGVLQPGRYWHSAFATEIRRVDVRPARIAVSGQEVLSADGVAVKASIAATYRIADPERAVLGRENYLTAIHSELQLALRSLASSMPIEELLRRRAEIPM